MTAASVEDFLAALAPETRETLERLRSSIRRVIPDATEGISYGVPTFRLDRPVVAYGATKSHCALYLMSTEVLEAHRAELAGYDISGGTVRFAPGTSLPEALVKELVKARLAENASLATKRAR